MRNDRPVTEADQAVARAFGREVPELTETNRAHGPEAEMTALLEEFRELRVSRRGDSQEVARSAAATKRILMAEPVMEGRRLAYKVTKPGRLRELRETVEALRAEVPLSAGASDERTPPAREYTPAEAEEAAASAFGRTTKGGSQ